MPIYEYKCISCGNIDEELESISSDKTVGECSVCKNESKKIISAGSFQLKGGGWYSDGYTKSKGCSTGSKSSPACAACPASQK